MTDTQTDIQLSLPDELLTAENKGDILQAMWYFHYKFNLNYTVPQIAEALGWTHRDSVYKALGRWKKNGSFQKAEEIMLLPQITEAMLANYKVITAWPEIVDRQIEIAVHSRSDQNSTAAAQFLKTEIHDPIMDKVADAGADESSYAKRPSDSAPDVITLPQHLVKAYVATSKPS